MTTNNKSIVDKVNKTFDDNNTEAFFYLTAPKILYG